MQGEKVPCEDQFRLREVALQNIQAALERSYAAVSQSLFIAVVLMSVYESIYGQHDCCTVHIQGLEQLIEARGGLKRSGVDDILHRLILWFDVDIGLSSALDGCDSEAGSMVSCVCSSVEQNGDG